MIRNRFDRFEGLNAGCVPPLSYGASA